MNKKLSKINEIMVMKMKKKRIYFFRRSFWQTKLINFFADNLNVSIELDNGFIYEGKLKKKDGVYKIEIKGP